MDGHAPTPWNRAVASFSPPPLTHLVRRLVQNALNTNGKANELTFLQLTVTQPPWATPVLQPLLDSLSS